MTYSDSPSPLGSIAFIGGGNMTRTLIGGMITRGANAASNRAAKPVAELRDALQRDFGIAVFADAPPAVADAGILVFAVKPQGMRSVCEVLMRQGQSSKLLAMSPGGTTQAAIETLDVNGFRGLIAKAIRNATKRGKELSAAHD